MKISSISLLIFIAGAFASAGCTVNNNSSADSCGQDSSVAGCGSAVGYSCTGNAVPTDTDSSLTCSDPTVASDGDSLFCCTSYTSTSGSTCNTDSTVNCSGGGFGFTCGGTDTPDQSDSSLECSTGTVNGSNTQYCCIQYSSGSGGACSQDDTVQGCQSGSYGFSCTGDNTPQQQDSSLNCSTGTPGSNGDTLFCCSNQ
jgi:hypothetical protein